MSRLPLRRASVSSMRPLPADLVLRSRSLQVARSDCCWRALMLIWRVSVEYLPQLLILHERFGFVRTNSMTRSTMVQRFAAMQSPVVAEIAPLAKLLRLEAT